MLLNLLYIREMVLQEIITPIHPLATVTVFFRSLLMNGLNFTVSLFTRIEDQTKGLSNVLRIER